MDRTAAWVDEKAVGLETSTLERLVAISAAVPFEQQVRLISALQGAVYSNGTRREFHEGLATRMFPSDPLQARVLQALRGDAQRVLLGEQTLLGWSRLAIEVGGLGCETRHPTSAESEVLLGQILLAVNSQPVSHGDESELDAAKARDLLLQIGSLLAADELSSALGRANHMFATLAGSDEAQARHDFCPIDTWLRAAHSGLGVEDQVVLGVSAMAGTRLLDTVDASNLAPLGWTREALRSTATNLGLSADAAETILTADRTWFAERFAAIEAQLQLPVHQCIAGWNRIPFDERPFVDLGDGELRLWDPRALISWMTDGLYYRCLNAAPSERDRRKFLTFYGWLFEQHTRLLLEDAHRYATLPGSGRPLRPQKYKKGQIETSDILLDHGSRLVFIEVYSGRMNIHAKLRGGSGAMETALGRLLDKAERLHQRVADYLGGKYELDGVDPGLVREVWPVLVVGAPLFLTEALGPAFTERLSRFREDERVRRLSVLSPGDVDLLCGLSECGSPIPDVLAAGDGAYEWLDLSRQVHENPRLSGLNRYSAMSQAVADDCFRAIFDRMGWNFENATRAEHRLSPTRS